VSSIHIDKFTDTVLCQEHLSISATMIKLFYSPYSRTTSRWRYTNCKKN